MEELSEPSSPQATGIQHDALDKNDSLRQVSFEHIQ